MTVFMLLVTFIGAHSTTIVGIGGYIFAQAGNTMPDLGTPDYFKVWAHDFFKAITASTKKK